MHGFKYKKTAFFLSKGAVKIVKKWTAGAFTEGEGDQLTSYDNEIKRCEKYMKYMQFHFIFYKVTFGPPIYL